jgi:nucleotide-binding universal stress UspA family protein
MDSTATTEVTELLVPLDRREASVRSVPVAGRIAKRRGLRLRLFTVAEDGDAAAGWLREVADRYLPGRDAVLDVGPPGDPAVAIVEAAGDSSLVCMATAGSLRPHGGHVGSVAEDVVRRIGRPVMLVGPQMTPDPGQNTQRVIAPIDGSKFSEACLDLACDLARRYGVPVWVVTVLSPESEAWAEAQFGDGPLVESGYVSRIAKQLAEKYDIDVEFEVLHRNDPARAIVDFAGDDGTVVMATHGRSGLNRLFGGSVTTGVVARSHRAVMVWRPDDE